MIPWTLYFSLFTVMIGYGATLSVLPFFIERMALDYGATSAQASFQVGMITGVFALMQFFFAPLWGRWSDRIGRRKPFLIGICGYAISLFFFGLSTNLLMLYLSRIVGGALAAAVLPAANAYVADMTSENERGQGMARLGSAAGLGVVVGPALGAFLARKDFHLSYGFGHFQMDGFSIPFFTASLISLLSFFFALRYLPKVSKQDDSSPASQSSGHGLSTKFGFRPEVLLHGAGFLLFLSFLNQYALSSFEGTFALHASQTIQFGPQEMGWIFTVCGFVMAAGQGTVVVWLLKRYNESRLLAAGFFIMAVGLVLLMTTTSMAAILIYVALFAFGVAIVSPCMASLLSQQAGHKTGVMLGRLNAVNNLGLATGPFVSGYFISIQIHAPYLLSALILFAAAWYCLYCVRSE